MNKTIKELDILISDGNYSSKYPRSNEFIENGIPFIRANNLVDGSISDEDMYYITPEKHSVLCKGHVKTGDVLITTRGNIGQVAIVPNKHDDSNINAQLVLLRTDNKKIYNRYLLWALQSRPAREQYLALQTGTALKQLPVGKLERLNIKITEIDKQHFIADCFDNIYEIIKDRRKELQCLDNLIKARFVEMFEQGNYPKVEFGDICVFLRNGANIKQTKGASGLPITRIETLANDVFNTDRLGYADIFEPGKYENYLLKSGDILISHINSVAYLGRAVQYRGQISSPVIHGMNLLCARIIDGYNPTYIEFFFKTPIAKDYISSITKKAVNQASITTSDLKKMMVPAPSIKKQNEFDYFVKQVDKSKVAVQKSLDEAQLLFDSLMQKYFG